MKLTKFDKHILYTISSKRLLISIVYTIQMTKKKVICHEMKQNIWFMWIEYSDCNNKSNVYTLEPKEKGKWLFAAKKKKNS